MFLSIYSKVTEVFHSDYIVLLAKAVSAAIYYVEFGIRIGLLCLSGIVRLDDSVLCAVDDENRTAIDDLRDILRIKPGNRPYRQAWITQELLVEWQFYLQESPVFRSRWKPAC